MSNKIFICDDDEAILELNKIILEDKGYEVIASLSSKNIVERIQDAQPNLVILDLWMPELSGDEIALMLKSNPVTAKIPVVISSASSESEVIAEQIGAVACLSKPFNIEELEKIAEDIIPLS